MGKLIEGDNGYELDKRQKEIMEMKSLFQRK